MNKIRFNIALASVLLLTVVAIPMPIWAAEVAAEKIDTVNAPPTDAAIRQRLEAIYKEVDGLGTVEVGVEAGVVTLSGQVLNIADISTAEKLSVAVNGVVAVQNDLSRDSRFNSQITPVINKFKSIGRALLIGLPLFLLALIIVLVLWWIGGLLARSIRLPRSWTPNLFVDELIRLFVRIAFGLIGLLVAAELLGATALLVSVLGGLGVLGLALSFAVKDTVENFVASILLSLRQPFGANEHVIISDKEGRVIRLTSRATILMDFDGNHLRIPNSVVYKSVITNFSRNPNRRFMFEVGIDSELNPAIAQQLAIDTLNALDGVLDDPSAACSVFRLGDSNVVLRVFGWVQQDVSDFGKTRSLAMSSVKQAFEAASISMPEPIYRLRVEGLDDKALPVKATVIDDAPAPVDAPVQDTTPDRTIEEQVALQNEGADLLSENAAKE